MTRITTNLTNCQLIVFAKAPIAGQVKTRLLSLMGPEEAALLHEKLVLHSLSKAVCAKMGPVDLWCAPTSGHPFFSHCAKTFQVNLYQQVESDLGEKMSYAFRETLKRSSCALLMGTDCPSLTSSDLEEARKALEKGVQAVLSPAEDGGYVMIGLHQHEVSLFERIPWGTASVLEETRERLRWLGWQWHELPERWDVDRPEDVERLSREGYGDLASFKTRG